MTVEMSNIPEPWVWVPFEVDKRFEGLRVDQFLAQRLTAYSRSKVQKILAEGRIVTQGRTVRASHKVRQGDKILIAYPRRPEDPLPKDIALPVLFEDEDFLIIHKPAQLLSHPTDKIQIHTVTHILRQTRQDLTRLHLLHRLDRGTSGVLALAKNPWTARQWTVAMESRLIHKDYIALVRGVPSPQKGIIKLPIGREGGDIKVRQAVNVPGAVSAVTRYEVLTSGVVLASPETGRLHQIRVHLAAIGHSILGDMLYQGQGEIYTKLIQKQTITEQDYAMLGFPRLALHAWRLTFVHPRSRKPLRVIAPLPEDMVQYCNLDNLLNCLPKS